MKETTIGVVSDTHIPVKAKKLPLKLLEGLKGVDFIIHAGDLMKDYIIYELEEIAPVQAVLGNNDDMYLESMLGTKKIININGKKIGVTHGDGSSSTTLKRVISEFKNDKVDCVVFGHSHIPFIEKTDGVLYLNPGSPTDKRRQEQYSYGILKINNNEILGEIILF